MPSHMQKRTCISSRNTVPVTEISVRNASRTLRSAMFKLDAATQPSSARKVRTRPVDARRSEMPEEVGEDHDVETSIPEQLLIDKVLGISDDHSLTICPSPLPTIVANHQELTRYRSRKTSRYPGESDSSRFDVALTHRPWYRACSSRVSLGRGWRVSGARTSRRASRDRGPARDAEV